MRRKPLRTVFGRRHTYEICAQEAEVMTRFVIYRDGMRWKGTYASLTRAIEVAEEAL